MSHPPGAERGGGEARRDVTHNPEEASGGFPWLSPGFGSGLGDGGGVAQGATGKGHVPLSPHGHRSRAQCQCALHRDPTRQGLCEVCFGQDELFHPRERSQRHRGEQQPLPKTTITPSESGKLHNQHLRYSRNGYSRDSRTLGGLKTRKPTQNPVASITAFLQIIPLLPRDRRRRCAAPRGGVAQSDRKKREQSRSCARSAPHPYIPSSAKVPPGAPKSHRGGRAAPSFPIPQSSLSGLRRDGDRQNPPVGSLPGLGEPGGIRTSPKPAQRCRDAATCGPRGHLHCHWGAAHHFSGLEGKEKSPYFTDIGELGFYSWLVYKTFQNAVDVESDVQPSLIPIPLLLGRLRKTRDRAPFI